MYRSIDSSTQTIKNDQGLPQIFRHTLDFVRNDKSRQRPILLVDQLEQACRVPRGGNSKSSIKESLHRSAKAGTRELRRTLFRFLIPNATTQAEYNLPPCLVRPLKIKET